MRDKNETMINIDPGSLDHHRQESINKETYFCGKDRLEPQVDHTEIRFTKHLFQSKLSLGALQKPGASPPTSKEKRKSSSLTRRNLEQNQAEGEQKRQSETCHRRI